MNTSRFSMYWNRRAILLTLAVSLALVVAACDGDPTATSTSAPATNTPTEEPTASPTTAEPTATAEATATPTATPSPRQGTEEVRTSVGEVPFDADSEVWIYGSGFEPGVEVYILITDSTGARTDISSGGGSVTPLVANDQGAWATKWTLGRFTREGVGVTGQFTLEIVDTSFNVLATTPIALCPTELAEGEEMPNFCSPLPEGTPIPGTPEPGASPTASPTP